VLLITILNFIPDCFRSGKIIMQRKSRSQSGLFNPRALFALALCSVGVFLAMLSFAATPPRRMTETTGQLSGNAKAASTTSLAPAAAGSWSLVPSPNTGASEYNVLQGVSCPSASDCWAVGYYDAAVGSHSQTLVERWDGNSWTIVNSANTSSAESNFLLGVTCTSATDCWAVGHHDSGDVAIFDTLIEHYDGVSWSVVNSPNSTEGQDNELQSVTCTSASDCWAVGYYSIGNPALPTGVVVYQTLVEHWDGTSWTIVTSPNSSPVENNNLHGVSCPSTVDCWAVGYSSSRVNGTLALSEHYDGTSWSIVTSPSPSANNYNVLLGVSCVSATDCWATGYYAGSTVEQSLMEHYDGASWSVVNSDNTGASNFPFGVTCASATDCWAAGFYNDSNGYWWPLIDRFDGTSWSVVSAPNPPPNSAGQYLDFLTAVTCSSTTDCWAVGYYFNVNGVQQTITEHYSIPPVQLDTVVSRKVHGSAGTFDVDLTNGNGIECRSGGANGDYTLVFTFANPLTSVDGAGVTTGTESISTSGIGPNPNQYTVNLTGVTNAQVITVSLTNVTDSAGNFSSAVAGQMGLLIGDVNASGVVDGNDVSAVQSATRQTVNSTNFRDDVNASGVIDGNDVSLTQGQTRTSLP
jgi:hypothetical protein